VIVNGAVVLPAALVTVTVCIAVEGVGGTIAEDTVARVPLRMPVLGSMLRPEGRSGLTLYVLPVGTVGLLLERPA